ncbi:hypothetical protein MMC30_008112 [Trapelia coarctata]|nr:hypothetical protein [Trapelia coarctata]
MQYTLALLGLAASVCAQGVTQIISPPAPAPTGCSPSFTGNFEINVQNVTHTSPKKRDLEKRVTACGGDGTLVLTLVNGLLKDGKGRTGYIADNRQFQFDGPPQTGAIYTAGFSVCANDTLALGGSAIFWQCLSGTFYNLYDESLGGQCNEVYIDIIPCVVNGATTVTASSMSTLPSSIVVVTSPTATTTSTTSKVSSLSTTTSSIMTSSLSLVAVTNSTTTSTLVSNITTTATGVLSSTDAHTTATTTAASTSAISTGAASVLSAGKEFAALAAGLAALVML